MLGTDFTECAELAVKAFFANAPVQVCAPAANIFSPTPITPTSLNAVHPAPGVAGKAGRTLTAVLDTILDLNRQVIGATLQANQALPAGAGFGGLRGGYARLEHGAVLLHRLSFVPGVELSGTFPVKEGKLQTTTVRITGAQAADGTVRVGSSPRVSGDLGGTRFNVLLAKIKLARAGAPQREWPTAPYGLSFPLPGLAKLP